MSKRATLVAAIDSYTGYGQHSLEIVRALQASGIYVSVRPIRVSEPPGQTIPPNIRACFVSGRQPEPWEIVLAPVTQFVPTPGKRTVFITMWESTRLPEKAVAMLNRCELVIVPTAWGASCFSASGVKTAIRVVPLGVDTKLFRPRAFPKTVVFGTGGRLGNGFRRKGVQDVIEAFLAAFPQEQNVKLRVKLFPDCVLPAMPDGRVEVIRAYYTPEQLADWYASLTCFVSGARAEGFGLMHAQAMASGRPVIGSIFGGLTEFMDAGNSYPVPFELSPAQESWKDCGHWAEPNREAMIEAMREVYRYPDKARVAGVSAARAVSRLTWERHNERLLSVLAEFGVVGETKRIEYSRGPRSTVECPRSNDPGIAVIMSTHNRQCTVVNALESLNESLAGRKWALFVSDDSKDGTLEAVRKHKLNAEMVIATGFTHTDSLGEGKNRAIRMARPYLNRYPWVTYQDDDDLSLPAKFDYLLPYAIEHGHDFLIGDVEGIGPNGEKFVDPAKFVLNRVNGGFGPGAVIHKSALLKDGVLFEERMFHDDDVTAFVNLENHGIVLGIHGGRPVYRHITTSKPDGSKSYVDRRFRNQVHVFDSHRRFNEPASFCTVAIGHQAALEASLLLRSIRLYHPRQPIFVACDEVGANVLSEFRSTNLHLLPIASAARLKTLSETVCKTNAHRTAEWSAVCSFKMDVISAAVNQCGDTLFLDADQVVVDRLEKPYPACDIGITSHHITSEAQPDQLVYYGTLNAGLVYCSNNDVASWWTNTFFHEMAKPSWAKTFSLDQPHGMFTDQSCLDLLPETRWKCSFYHEGYNVGFWRFIRIENGISFCSDSDPDSFIVNQGFEIGYGIFLNGYPVKTLHLHAGIPADKHFISIFGQSLTRILAMSTMPEHAEILKLIRQSESSLAQNR